MYHAYTARSPETSLVPNAPGSLHKGSVPRSNTIFFFFVTLIIINTVHPCNAHDPCIPVRVTRVMSLRPCRSFISLILLRPADFLRDCVTYDVERYQHQRCLARMDNRPFPVGKVRVA